jgi:hypothetical protein
VVAAGDSAAGSAVFVVRRRVVGFFCACPLFTSAVPAGVGSASVAADAVALVVRRRVGDDVAFAVGASGSPAAGSTAAARDRVDLERPVGVATAATTGGAASAGDDSVATSGPDARPATDAPRAARASS